MITSKKMKPSKDKGSVKIISGSANIQHYLNHGWVIVEDEEKPSKTKKKSKVSQSQEGQDNEIKDHNDSTSEDTGA